MDNHGMMDDKALIDHIRGLLKKSRKKRSTDKITLETIQGGFENKVYLLKIGSTPYVLKRRFDGDFERYPREYHALSVLRDSGIAPQPLLTDLAEDSPFAPLLIIRKMPGTLLGSVAMTEEVAGKIADAFRGLHTWRVADASYPFTCGFTRLADYFDRILDYFRFYLRGRAKDSIADDPLIERIADFFEALGGFVEERAPLFEEPAPLCLCHGDIRLHNMLYYRGKVTFIDWERSGLGDPAFELGLIPIFGHMRQPCEDAVYRAYTRNMERPELFLERMRAYQAVHYFAWPIHMISFLYKLKRDGYKGSWDEDAFVARYLREAYDWLAYAFRRAGPLLGIDGEERTDANSLKERGVIFSWKDALM